MGARQTCVRSGSGVAREGYPTHGMDMWSSEGAPFAFPAGVWPTPDGRHPWHGRESWQGHGTLMLQRPGDSYAVWHFWYGPERAFVGWYLNPQEPFLRTAIGYDTQDLGLDIWVFSDGSWAFKDLELLSQRVAAADITVLQG